MSDVFTTKYWAKEYTQPPLKSLERVDGGDVEKWVNQNLAFIGTDVDWDRVSGSYRHWLPTSADEAALVVVEFLAALPGVADVVHVGDSLSPYAVRIPREDLDQLLAALLAIPEHHYFVADDRSWCGVFRVTGHVDLVVLDTSQ
jgi:hypothetical protein